MKMGPHETIFLPKAKFLQWKINLRLTNFSFYIDKSPLLKPQVFFHQLSIIPMNYETLFKNISSYNELVACCKWPVLAGWLGWSLAEAHFR